MIHTRFLLTVLLVFMQLSCGSDDTQDINDAASYEKVFKYDGSIQCGSTGVDVDIMVSELTSAGIDVICSQKGSDGMLRAALCGLGTGSINIYTIDIVNLHLAEGLGFESVKTLVGYQDEQCQ